MNNSRITAFRGWGKVGESARQTGDIWTSPSCHTGLVPVTSRVHKCLSTTWSQEACCKHAYFLKPEISEPGKGPFIYISHWTVWEKKTEGLKLPVRCEMERVSCSVLSESLRPHGLQPTRLLCPWESPGKNTGVGCRALLHGTFPTQGLNKHLLQLCVAGDFLTAEPPRRPNEV